MRHKTKNTDPRVVVTTVQNHVFMAIIYHMHL